MKNSLFLFLALSLTQLPLFSQTPTVAWLRTISSPAQPDEVPAEGIDFVTDPQGNSYFLGYYYDKLLLEPGVPLDNSGSDDWLFLVKYSPAGDLLWVSRITGPPNGLPFQFGSSGRLAVDNTGNVYVSGNFLSDSVMFGNDVLVERSCQFGCEELFIAQYNSAGIAQWAKTIRAEDAASHQIGGLGCDALGNLYLAGIHGGNFMGFPGNNDFENLAGNGLFIARLNNQAEPMWVRFLEDNSAFAELNSMAVSANGNIFIGGSYYDGPLVFNDGTTLPLFSGQDYYVAAYKADGALQWVKNLHSDDYLDVLDLDADNLGNVYIACDLSGELRSGANQLIPAGTSFYTGVLLRMNTTEFGLPVVIPFNDDGYTLLATAVSPEGQFYTGGFFTNSPLEVGDFEVTNVGCANILISTGLDDQIQGAYSFGGPNCEGISNFYYGSAMDLDALGNLYISGVYYQGLDIDDFEASGGGMFVAKLQTGTPSSTPEYPDAGLAFRLTPNPTSGAFQVRFDQTVADGWVILNDLNGRELLRQAIQGEVLTFSPELAEGVYLLYVQTPEGHSVQKLIVSARQ